MRYRCRTCLEIMLMKFGEHERCIEILVIGPNVRYSAVGNATLWNLDPDSTNHWCDLSDDWYSSAYRSTR
jgi:hypothetical protein